MMTASTVLVVGHPNPDQIKFGAACVPGLTEAKDYCREHRPAAVAFSTDSATAFEDFCAYLNLHCPDAQWIVTESSAPPAPLTRWLNAGRIHDIIASIDDPELERKLQAAAEASLQAHQNAQLLNLFADQSERLKRLSQELEDRVNKRHKTLRKSLRTLEETKRQLEIFHKAFLAIHRAASVRHMESSLIEALAHLIETVKIRFSSQSSLRRNLGAQALCIDLDLRSEGPKGEVVFTKKGGAAFSADEIEFLGELSDAIALALSRLQKLEQAESLKAEWQATFDAIPYPLCLTTPDHRIMKMNAAFQAQSRGRSFAELIGRDCFEVFLDAKGRDEPRFRVARPGPRGTEHFEVTVDALTQPRDTDEAPARQVLFRPVTEEVRFERRLLEASKLAELGTIGSSIAHELNNPLGGMLSYLQLILMDLDKSDPLYPDIKEMESATLRCRDIVQNLLSFARKQDPGEMVPIAVTDVIRQAIKLIELQSKSLGIEVELLPPEGGSNPAVLASPGVLSQALCNILQNSIDAISDRLKAEPLFPGHIRVRVDSDAGSRLHHIRITDNGTGIRPEVQSQIFNPTFTTRDSAVHIGMGLTTAFTIISEHHGSLEIVSQTGSGTTAIISLPSLDLTPERRDFDGQI